MNNLTESIVMEYLTKKAPKFFKSATDWETESTISQIIELNDALVNGRSVFAVKEPSGRSNYSVFYVTKEGVATVFFPSGYQGFFGMKKNQRNFEKGGRGWTFGTSVYGMSWVLAATDTVFERLKDMGGYYAQIKEI